MVQSPSSASPILGKRYSIYKKSEQQPGQSLYLAQDQFNGDTCIIKKIKAPSDAQATVISQHLQNETGSFLNWQHPQFEQVRDCFVQGSSVLIVQDEVTGQTCADLLEQKGNLSETELRPVLESILAALAGLHRRSLSHRNISPQTLQLRIADNQPVLTQFRFVRDVLVELGAKAAQPSLVEQAQTLTDQPTPTGAAEDLYALALTSMMLLTGQELAALYNPQAQTWQWEEHQLVTDSLSQALGRMLSRNEGDRFTSADEFLHALRKVEPLAPDAIPPKNFGDSHGTMAPAAMAPNAIAPDAMPTTQVAPQPPVSSTAQVAGAAIQQQYQRNRGMTIAVGAGVAGLLSALAFFTMRGEPQPKVVVTSEYSNQSVADNANSNSNSNVATSSISTIQTTKSESNNEPKQQESLTTEKEVPRTSSTYSISTQNQSSSLPLGWIRVGAVANTTGYAAIGERLIATSQPVTIYPGSVPAVGQNVRTVTGVNLRASYPQAPYYRLESRVSTLLSNQPLKILALETFVDATSSSPYTVVWAQVGKL